eukprot:PITA_33757
MDDFTPYGSNFQEALTNLGKVLTKCIEMNLSLNPEKCEFLMIEGTVLGHTISQQGLQVDPNKIAIIQKVPPPQKVEVTNRVLEEILTKVVSNNGKDWADRLVEATWAYNTTWKTTTGFTPYELVYGKKALLSIEFEYNTLRVATQLDLDLSHAQHEILLQLNGLDEQRMQALLYSEVAQLQTKIWHDEHLN